MFIALFSLTIAGYITNSYVFNYRPEHTFILFPIVIPIAAFGLINYANTLHDSILNIKLSTILIIFFIISYGVISFIGAFYSPSGPIRDTFPLINAILAIIK